jgi:hypothetical protein
MAAPTTPASSHTNQGGSHDVRAPCSEGRAGCRRRRRRSATPRRRGWARPRSSSPARAAAPRPAPSLPSTSAVARRGQGLHRPPVGRRPGCGTPRHAGVPRPWPSASTTGTRSDEPAAERTALGFHGSTVPGSAQTSDAPNASALRTIVPKLPGSCTASSSTTRAYARRGARAERRRGGSRRRPPRPGALGAGDAPARAPRPARPAPAPQRGDQAAPRGCPPARANHGKFGHDGDTSRSSTTRTPSARKRPVSWRSALRKCLQTLDFRLAQHGARLERCLLLPAGWTNSGGAAPAGRRPAPRARQYTLRQEQERP